MSTRKKQIATVIAMALLPLALILSMTFPRAAVGAAIAPEQSAIANAMPPVDSNGAAPIVAGYYWNFSAKFVCGFVGAQQPGTPGEPIVKPGNYATEINIHNYNYKQLPLKKKVIVLVDPQNPTIGREPNAVQPRAFADVSMGPDFGMFDDCNQIWSMVFPALAPPSPMPLFIGYLVVVSPLDLDIDAVYTANAPGTVGTTPTGISIDVNRVPGKRVYIPAGALP
jgi:hypothetical protein